jgi:hypothetical protein
MRLILEIILAAALIALAWETPYRETVSNVVPWVSKSATIKRPTVPDATIPQEPSTPRPVVTHRPITTPAPTVSGAWMWDANRKSTLDRPSPGATQARRP